LRFDPSGSVSIIAGTHSHGQGHATAYAQVLSNQLGIPFDRIRVVLSHPSHPGNIGAAARAMKAMGLSRLVLAEPDGTFLPGDVLKLLVYSDDCEAVFGTRTTRELIWRGANMGWFLKWGNWAVAKLVEALFNTSHLSDVGCTYRLLHRDLAQRLLPEFRVGDSHFGPELMLRTIASGARFVEVPVNYLPRVGVSSVTGDFWKALVLGNQMIWFILRFRLATLGKTRRPLAQPALRRCCRARFSFVTATLYAWCWVAARRTMPPNMMEIPCAAPRWFDCVTPPICTGGRDCPYWSAAAVLKAAHKARRN